MLRFPIKLRVSINLKIKAFLKQKSSFRKNLPIKSLLGYLDVDLALVSVLVFFIGFLLGKFTFENSTKTCGSHRA